MQAIDICIECVLDDMFPAPNFFLFRNIFSRYDLPGIFGFNFVLENVLGGGGIASLRSDPQASYLL